jgi:hypothetical protein
MVLDTSAAVVKICGTIKIKVAPRTKLTAPMKSPVVMILLLSFLSVLSSPFTGGKKV